MSSVMRSLRLIVGLVGGMGRAGPVEPPTKKPATAGSSAGDRGGSR
jgi:hypothetical protein